MEQQQWQDFLTQQGASWTNHQAQFPDTDGQLHLVDLSPMGAIAIEGPDSQKFLQGQLTCDLVSLPDEHATLGSHCNPKGRMISAFQALKLSQSECILSMPQDLIQTALAALKRYAVFFKTELRDISEEIRWIGIAGRGADECALNMLTLDKLSKGSVTPFDCNGQRALAHLISDRQIALCVPALQAADLWQRLAGKPAAPASYRYWQAESINAGIPQLHAATSERFIPQLLNLHVLNGVSFKKGCYTGQEIIARMQYLGAAKQRMFRAEVTATAETENIPKPGSDIFADGTQSIGSVVQACATTDKHPSDTVDMLVVLTKSKVAEGTPLKLADGRPLEILELPYDADADPLA